MQEQAFFKLGSVRLSQSLLHTTEDLLKGVPRNYLKEFGVVLRKYIEGKEESLHESELVDTSPTKSGITPMVTKHILNNFQGIKPIYMSTQGGFVYNDAMTLTYLMEYFPSLYAINLRIMKELQGRLTDFFPQSVLDFGCGPGSASLAIMNTWSESVERVMGIDTSDSMLEVARRLITDAHPSFNEDRHILQRYLPLSVEPTYDLVVASYVLNEFRNDSLRLKTLQTLWNLTKDVLILVQPGHKLGFQQLQQAREWILSHNSNDPKDTSVHTVAPCPHDKQCPLLEKNSWCYFGQRSEKTQPQLETHGGKFNFLDERYSYIVLRRGQRPANQGSVNHQSFSWPRQIRRPLIRSGHVIFDMCHSEGHLLRHIIAKSHGKEIYRDSRDSFWGDLWPHKLIVKKELKHDTPTDY